MCTYKRKKRGNLTPNPRGAFYFDMAIKQKHIACMTRSEKESFIVWGSSLMSQKCEKEELIVNVAPGEVVHENPYCEEKREIKDE